MAISKLILNGEVQMDVTSDTVSANRMLNGYTATKNDGTKVTGNIASKTSSDLTASGATVTAPAGYYASNASKSISNGTQGTPSFNRNTGTNSTTLTPVVVNTAGYINGGTRTGTAVTISASELVSGTKSITSNGTGIDVANYANVNVNVSATPGPGEYVSYYYDNGWFLSDEGRYVSDVLNTETEDFWDKLETDILMVSSSMSFSDSNHESTATINLSDNMSNGKGFVGLISVYYGEADVDYIWLWSESVTIGSAQLNFISTLGKATVKRASFTSATVLQVVFDWQNVYDGVNDISGFQGNRYSSGLSISNPTGIVGVVVEPPNQVEQITENGTYNVKGWKTAEVNVSSGGTTFGSFKVTATSLPTFPNYIGIIAMPPISGATIPSGYIPFIIYINNTGSSYAKTLYWPLDSDGYMHVTLYGQSDMYTPRLTATSGTATRQYGYRSGSTYTYGSTVYYKLGCNVLYKISDGAEVNLDYYNDN